MGLLDRLRGAGMQRPIAADSVATSADDPAIARYRYMLRTAPPETIEQAHAEAFAHLTPEQRQRVLQGLAREIPEAERAAAARAGDNPGDLARVATRAEIRQPGALERVFGGLGAMPGAAPGFGSMFAGSFAASMAGSVLGSVIAQHFFAGHGDGAHLFGDASPHAGAHDDHVSSTDADRTDTNDLDGSAIDPGIGDFDAGFGDGGSFDV